MNETTPAKGISLPLVVTLVVAVAGLAAAGIFFIQIKLDDTTRELQQTKARLDDTAKELQQTKGELAELTPTAAELKPLQGYWEGVDWSGGQPRSNVSITITGDSLHYRAGSNWYKTTFTLSAGTDPQQLYATIKDSSPPTNHIGELVPCIFKIEDGTLTFAASDHGVEPPKNFEDVMDYHHVLRKVQPQKTTQN